MASSMQANPATSSRRAGLIFTLWAVSALIASTPSVAGQGNGPIHCPPQPGDGAVLNGDVDGDGNRDWHFPNVDQTDAGGNKVVTYCLAKPANRFHVVYVDKETGESHTVGGCFFPRGRNRRSKEQYTEGRKVGEWKTVDWHNWDPDTGADWHFEFDTETKTLEKKKTQGETIVVARDGVFYDVYVYEVIDTEVEHAPVGRELLRLRNRPLEWACPRSGCPGVSMANVSVDSVSWGGGEWEFQMKTPVFGGDGSEDAPFEGIMVHVEPGDSLRVAGVGIFAASVGGSAAAPENGEWIVAEINAKGVRFEATHEAELLPGFLLTGFELKSSVHIMGTVTWSTVGDDIRYDGKVSGPGVIRPTIGRPVAIDTAGSPSTSSGLMSEIEGPLSLRSDVTCGARCTCTPPAINPCPGICIAESVKNNCVQNGNSCNANPNGRPCTFTCSLPTGGQCPGWPGPANGVCRWIQGSCVLPFDDAGAGF